MVGMVHYLSCVWCVFTCHQKNIILDKYFCNGHNTWKLSIMTVKENKIMNELEYELIKKYKLEHDIDARNKVIEMNMGYIHLLASKYHGVMYDDLVQEGLIELMRTINNYDLQYNPRLITFSHNALQGAINRYFLRNSDVVTKYTTKPLLKMIKNASKYFFDGSDDIKIMQELNVSKIELERFKCIQPSSLELDNDEIDLHIASNYTDNPLDILLSDEKNDTVLQIQNIINQMDSRIKDIMTGRWMQDDDNHTLMFYAEKYGISGERVRQLEKNCIKRISKMVDI